MAKYQDKADWTQIDAGSLTSTQQAAYEAYRVVRRQAAAARDAFEQTMQEGLAQGERMVCGYNFGKLSVAIVAEAKPKAKPAAKATSLSDYLAQRRAGGHAA